MLRESTDTGTPAFFLAFARLFFFFVGMVHTQTDLNKLEVCQGRRLNPPLNEKGRGQARALLSGTELSAILCSPLRRARETAGIVRERYDEGRFCLCGLVEVSWTTVRAVCSRK